jgi:hypothetical protein
MTGAPDPSELHQSQPSNSRCSLVESLDQLIGTSQRLAEFAAKATGIATDDGASPWSSTNEPPSELVRKKFDTLFHPDACEGYDGSETMENARVEHMQAALQMYAVMSDQHGPARLLAAEEEDLASRIGHAIRGELIEYYRVLAHGNDRTTFTTEQRTALESAFLLKSKLNAAEKRALARTCNLSPRQVEVWVRAFCYEAKSRLVFKQTHSKKARRTSFGRLSRGKELRDIGPTTSRQ